MADENVVIEQSSGNVYADLNLPNAEERYAKIKLAASIASMLTERSVSVVDAAVLFDIALVRMEALFELNMAEFSLSELMHFARQLDCDVVVELRPRALVGRTAVMESKSAA